MTNAAPTQNEILAFSREAIRLVISARKAKSEIAKRVAASGFSNFAARVGSADAAEAFIANARRAVAFEAGGNLHFCRVVREATTFA